MIARRAWVCAFGVHVCVRGCALACRCVRESDLRVCARTARGLRCCAMSRTDLRTREVQHLEGFVLVDVAQVVGDGNVQQCGVVEVVQRVVIQLVGALQRRL